MTVKGMPERAGGTRQGENGAKAVVWSSRSLAFKWQYRFFYALLKIGGLGPARFFLFFVTLVLTLRPEVFGRSRHYLERRFGPAPFFRRFGRTFRLYLGFANVILDRAAGGILGRLDIAAPAEDVEAFRSALAGGKGLIVLSAHAGCWQTAVAGLNFGRVVQVVQYRDARDIDRHVFEYGSFNDFPEIKLISATSRFGGFVEMTAALSRGEIICLMGDRVTLADRHSIRLDFLGGEVSFPGAAYMLAAVAKVPVFVVFSTRIGSCKVESRIYAKLEVQPRLPRTVEALRPYVQRFASALEEFVREYPFQFFNFYDLWTLTNKENRADDRT